MSASSKKNVLILRKISSSFSKTIFFEKYLLFLLLPKVFSSSSKNVFFEKYIFFLRKVSFLSTKSIFFEKYLYRLLSSSFAKSTFYFYIFENVFFENVFFFSFFFFEKYLLFRHLAVTFSPKHTLGKHYFVQKRLIHYSLAKKFLQSKNIFFEKYLLWKIYSSSSKNVFFFFEKYLLLILLLLWKLSSSSLKISFFEKYLLQFRHLAVTMSPKRPSNVSLATLYYTSCFAFLLHCHIFLQMIPYLSYHAFNFFIFLFLLFKYSNGQSERERKWDESWAKKRMGNIELYSECRISVGPSASKQKRRYRKYWREKAAENNIRFLVRGFRLGK